MKRLNPVTNQPFRSGDVREDGYVFLRYESRTNKAGYQVESWLHPEKHQRQNDKKRNKAKREYKHDGSRLLWGWADEIGDNPHHLENCRKLWRKINTDGMTKAEIKKQAVTEDICLLLTPYASDYHGF